MRSGKTAIATCLCVDASELDAYQSTRTRSVFQYDGTLYHCRKLGSRHVPDPSYIWALVPDQAWFNTKYGLEVIKALD